MEFLAVIKKRRSVRAYEDREVDKATLSSIFQCADRAPSAGNLQAYEVVVVRDAGRRQALSRCALGQRQVAEAPVVLVFCTDPARSSDKYGSRGATLYAVQDATIACAHAQLAATALGLATCWVGAFHERQVRDLVNAPTGAVPVALLTVGHASETPRATARRSLSDLVKWEKF